MAMIQLARVNSGSEAAIKVFSALTDSITLHNGRILIGQESVVTPCATKLSLFVDLGTLPESRTIGERNVWLVEDDEGLLICFGHEKEARGFRLSLKQTKNWKESFPESNRNLYNLKHLDRAAREMRNFFLLGIYPNHRLTDAEKERIDQVLKEVEIDIVATIDFSLVDFG